MLSLSKAVHSSGLWMTYLVSGQALRKPSSNSLICLKTNKQTNSFVPTKIPSHPSPSPPQARNNDRSLTEFEVKWKEAPSCIPFQSMEKRGFETYCKEKGQNVKRIYILLADFSNTRLNSFIFWLELLVQFLLSGTSPVLTLLNAVQLIPLNTTQHCSILLYLIERCCAPAFTLKVTLLSCQSYSIVIILSQPANHVKLSMTGPAY